MITWGNLDSELATTYSELTRVSEALDGMSKAVNRMRYHDSLMSEVNDMLEDLSVFTSQFNSKPAPPLICNKVRIIITLIDGILKKSTLLQSN